MNPDDVDLYKFECIKCGNPNAKNLYDFTETKRRSKRHRIVITNRNIKIPLCDECKKEFEAWEKNPIINLSLSDKILVPLIGIGLTFGGIFLFLIFKNPWFILMGVLGIGLLAFFILLIIVSREDDTENNEPRANPYQYVKFDKDKVMVRPQGKGNWISYNYWIQNIAQLRVDTAKIQEIKKAEIQRKDELKKGINIIFCPNCGEKYNKGTDFCVKCGKDLRTLKENQ
ncbi:MAG: zinc ribbon domain-containing protein [Promethearchaeia archaeon]